MIYSKIHNTIQYNTTKYNTIQRSTIQFNKVQYNDIQYTIQYNTTKYNTIQNSVQYSHTWYINRITNPRSKVLPLLTRPKKRTQQVLLHIKMEF